MFNNFWNTNPTHGLKTHVKQFLSVLVASHTYCWNIQGLRSERDYAIKLVLMVLLMSYNVINNSSNLPNDQMWNWHLNSCTEASGSPESNDLWHLKLEPNKYRRVCSLRVNVTLCTNMQCMHVKRKVPHNSSLLVSSCL